MYEDDTPPAERRAQALSLDRDLLRELLGQEELRDLLDPDALEEVERQLAGDAAHPRRAARPAAPPRRPARRASTTPSWPSRCSPSAGRCSVRVGGRGAPDRRRGRGPLPRRARGDAAGGLPTRSSRPIEEPLQLAAPPLRARRGPFTTAEANERFGRDVERDPASSSSATSELVRGELRPGGTEREWCDPEVLRRLRRASLAALRKEVEPAEQAAFAPLPPGWHGIDRRATLREALVPLQALPLPVALWESEVLPRRVPGYRPEQLDALCATGEVVWVGAGLDRVALYFREDAPRSAACRRADAGGRGARPRSAPRSARSALFWHDLLDDTGLEAEEALPALWDLVWAGEVTNDAWPPLRAGRRYGAPQAERRAAALLAQRAAAAITATQGRWSLTARLFAGRARPARARGAAARAAGDRHARRRPRRRGSPAATARSTRSCARSRRSASAAAATSSRASAARSSRSAARSSACASCGRATGEEPEPLVLAAADPAQPYGAALPWPKRAGARAARVAGAYVVLLGGEAALFVERGGRSLVPLREPEEAWLRAGARGARRARAAGGREAARGRALRRRAGAESDGHAAALEAGLRRRPAAGRAPSGP